MASSPSETWSDAKRILVGIIHEAGGEFAGKTRLYKAFWRAHLEHWRAGHGALTLRPIVHMPRGPGIDGGNGILRQMIREKTIASRARLKITRLEVVYTLVNPDAVSINANEREAIRSALSWLGDRGAVDASEDSHRTSRSWREAEQQGRTGCELSIYLDLLSDEEYDRRAGLLEDQETILRGALGQTYPNPA